MPAFRPDKIQTIQASILRWYQKNKRSLQWRTTRDPYEILVSEIMLQQTQVSRVQEKLPIFLKKFPSIRSLARASTADVIHAWRGMGYNNRAVRLRNLARIVVEDYREKLPSDPEQLLQLPGIGRYTANALACFAFRQHMPVVDVNVRRVLSRLLWKMKDSSEYRPAEEIWSVAEKVLPKKSYDWNQALMDLGSTICTAQKPKCESCPVYSLCRSKYLNRHKIAIRLTVRKKSEPLYEGIPHRIWRGRIVEVLRNVNGKRTISVAQLGKTVKPLFRKQELPWLNNLIGALEKDGIISRARSNVMLSEQ